MDLKTKNSSKSDTIFMARSILLSRPLPPELIVADTSDANSFRKVVHRATSDSYTCRTLKKLDSEDSSYDSDLDLSCSKIAHQSVGPTKSLSKIENSLSCLSLSSRCARTFSETLGRDELSDDGASETSSDDEDMSKLIKEHPVYPNHVEYGIKLGYSESQVFKALKKLGTSPSQDKLLCQLIKISENAQKIKTQKVIQKPEVLTVVEKEVPAQQVVSLRKIVIDGSNVAMSHGNKQIFSCRGLRICVDWFKSRGHNDITVFVPKWRKESSRPEAPITDQEILLELEREGMLVFTPSRFVDGRRIVCYDDRYILKTAAEDDGIVVSNDNYRDLAQESTEFKKVVEERILMYTFVSDRFMPPDDPLGRSGPTLDDYLRKIPPHLANSMAPPCPYGKKCTYGNKCKFQHPERGNLPQKSVTERLQEQASQRKLLKGQDKNAKAVSLPAQPSSCDGLLPAKRNLARTNSVATGFTHEPMQLNRSPSKTTSLPIPVDQMQQMLQQPPPNHPWHGLPQDQHENLHRPVQRQLSLNPSGDARLTHYYPCGVNRLSIAPERPLPGYYYPVEMQHAQIARNASAPGAFMPRERSVPFTPQFSRLSSTSDTQLNLLPDSLRCSTAELDQNVWSSTPKLLPWYPHSRPLYPEYSPDSPGPSYQHVRDEMYFHFSALFPEGKVRAAMALLPKETDPQKICSVIMELIKNNP
ncbi:ribonuclease ZC3H12A-like [Artemia franciscana]|uniref:C3H1-type domain-containing protein n=1 Tax=Artemia franciscana TaxID=6661 RepID=A0AA88HU73_ARTSF|nr:hypothetical protein QYM36_010759 [Artemia franciscana]